MLCRHADLRGDRSLGEADAAVVLPEQALEPLERHRGESLAGLVRGEPALVMAQAAGGECLAARLRPAAGVEAPGRHEQLLARRLLEPTPALERSLRQADVVRLRIREPEQAARPVRGAPCVPDLELLEENARPAALAERAGSGAPHHAPADDDCVHLLHGSDRIEARAWLVTVAYRECRGRIYPAPTQPCRSTARPRPVVGLGQASLGVKSCIRT